MNAGALAVSRDDLLTQVPHDLLGKNSDVVTQRSISFAKKHAMERHLQDTNHFRRTLQELIAVALSKRVGPGRAMTVKQLAHALRIDQQTAWKLLNGYNSPSGPVLMALISFFDSSFANEILVSTGCTVAKVSDARAAALRKYAEAQEELRRLG